MLLGRDDLVEGFTELGSLALLAGKMIDLAVYGGSCLMLVSNFRDASQDVDAVASRDQQLVDQMVARSRKDEAGHATGSTTACVST